MNQKGEDGYTKSQRDFISKTFTTERGSILKVERLAGKSKNYISIFEISCSVCSKDRELFPENFLSQKGNLVDKHGVLKQIPCGCSWNTKYSEEQWIILVKREAEKRNMKFLGWYGGFKGANKTLISLEGTLWKPIMKHFMDGREQFGGGYDPIKSGRAYIVRWSQNNISYLKMGITNRKVEERLKEQQTHAKLSPTILFTFENDDGKLVANAETHIKSYLNNGVCPKDLLPDGYTETYEDTQDNLTYMVNYLSQKLN